MKKHCCVTMDENLKDARVQLFYDEISGVLSLGCMHAESSTQKDFDEFKRIKELLICIG